MKEITELVNWLRNPKSRNSEAIEAIKATHFAYSFNKNQNMSSVSQKTVPTTRQTMTRPFCSHLIKALLNQQLLCQVTHPALKASVSSITDCSHRGSGNLELQTQLQEAVLLWDKKHLLVPHCREGQCFQHWSISTQTFTLAEAFVLPLQKGGFWLLWHYT